MSLEDLNSNDTQPMRQALKVLQESNGLLSALIENLPGGAVFVVDRGLRYLWAQGEALSAAGFTPEVFVGRTISETLPAAFATQYEGFYRQALAGEPFETEHKAHHHWYMTRGTPLRSPDGDVYAVLAVSFDITERKRAEDERLQVETAIAADLSATQLLQDLSAKLVAAADLQVLYDEIVAAAIALTEADAGSLQVLDEATQELVLSAIQGIPPLIAEQCQRVKASANTPCGSALTVGQHTFTDFDVPESEDPDGSLRLHIQAGLRSAQSTPLMSRSGKPIGMVSTHWQEHHRPSDRQLRFLDLLARQAADLIEQRQTVAEREQLLAREQATRTEDDCIKAALLAGLTYELRSPLNSILGWSKLLQRSDLDADTTQQGLQAIERHAKLQAELVEELLDVSRLFQGKLKLNAQSINLVSVIQAAMETVRLAAESKAIKLEASFEPNPLLIQGDSTRLQKVIWHLLSNAVKFTPSGGQVNIRLARLDSCAQMTISDTGEGIEPAFLPYVFESFRQAYADGMSAKHTGLGIGLLIVQHLVELHGGTVAVESLGVGRGATFTVRLPLSPI